LRQDTLKLIHGAVAEKGSISLDDVKKRLAEALEGEENVCRSVRDFRADFGKLLEEAKRKTLVVFIDDLDRCLPDTIIATLKAIELFLFVSGTAFVIGADERPVPYTVRLRFPERSGTGPTCDATTSRS
jgi:predicted KAP-like P-loop ATPase